MQSIKKLQTLLDSLSDSDHFLFIVSDFVPVFHELEYNALKSLLSRAVKGGVLKRVSKGVYLNEKIDFSRGLVLYHTAARLRAGNFNYISLETALSDAGVISQIPINWITVMSSGRTNIISCDDYGSIEFVHTKKVPGALAGRIFYDTRCGMWRASVKLAIQDMRDTKRSLDLIDWRIVDELV